VGIYPLAPKKGIASVLLSANTRSTDPKMLNIQTGINDLVFSDFNQINTIRASTADNRSPYAANVAKIQTQSRVQEKPFRYGGKRGAELTKKEHYEVKVFLVQGQITNLL
jgi:hypothetical protein